MVDSRLKKDKRAQQKQTRQGKKQKIKRLVQKKTRPNQNADD